MNHQPADITTETYNSIKRRTSVCSACNQKVISLFRQGYGWTLWANLLANPTCQGSK